jgi:hypothetical protein
MHLTSSDESSQFPCNSQQVRRPDTKEWVRRKSVWGAESGIIYIDMVNTVFCNTDPEGIHI